jgi:hypothetical protein
MDFFIDFTEGDVAQAYASVYSSSLQATLDIQTVSLPVANEDKIDRYIPHYEYP